ncbi:MAG: Fe-S protein assembly co-chaperone HscB [Paucibacter sp.]|nr:Fe-S protein assembly co-chaperone HscB [Roseateles sp.]
MKLTDNDFALFGLPERQQQERAEIDARWKSLQAQVHPDRFASEGAAAQRVAMQWAVRVNEAHKRLRDPLARAAYLCELRGAPIQANENTAMPASFLMEQMEWREALDEAVGVAAIEALDVEVDQREKTLLSEVQQLLDDENDATTAASAAAQKVRALMFVQRFRSDIAKRLDNA